MAEGSSTPKNIFEAASQVEKARLHKEGPTVSLSIDEMFRRCIHLHQEIESKIDKAFSSNQISPNQLQEYMATPKNFNEKQWRIINEQKHQNEIMIQELAKKLIAEAQRKEGEKPAEKKETPKAEKRSRPVTRRQWLGMR